MSRMLSNLIREIISEALWTVPVDLKDYEDDSEDHFNEPVDAEEIEYAKKNGDLYFGRNVIWIGEKGRMLKVTSDELSPAEGNQFDFAKMAAVKNYIENSEDRVYFNAPIAQIVTIGIEAIKETQRAYQQDRLDVDYSNIDEPFSIGDEDLDLYLGSPEKWHEENLYSDYDDYLLFEKNPKLWIKEWLTSEDPKLWTEEDKEQYSMALEEFEEHKKAKKEIEEAIESGDGDLDSIWVDLRDGNHRAFGSLAAGEPYVWVIAMKERTDASVELQ